MKDDPSGTGPDGGDSRAAGSGGEEVQVAPTVVQRSVAGQPAWALRVVAAAVVVSYLAAIALAGDLRSEHVVLGAAALVLVAVGGRVFDFVLCLSPVILTGILYDSFRYVAHLRGPVHVGDVFAFEQRWFAVPTDPPLMLADYFAVHHWPLLDLLTGAAYIIYLYVPMALAVALYFVERPRAVLLGVTFFATTALGLAIYLAFPVAPPWYVAEYGLGPVVLDAAPSAAGAARFDALTGTSYFESFYARSANVFGAMPSLHMGFAMVAVLPVIARGPRWWVPTGAFAALVGFSAVYLQHHYVVDVLAGVVVACLGYGIARVLTSRIAAVARLAAAPSPS